MTNPLDITTSELAEAAARAAIEADAEARAAGIEPAGLIKPPRTAAMAI